MINIINCYLSLDGNFDEQLGGLPQVDPSTHLSGYGVNQALERVEDCFEIDSPSWRCGSAELKATRFLISVKAECGDFVLITVRDIPHQIGIVMEYHRDPAF